MTEPTVPASTQPPVAVPNIIGLKIATAHRALRDTGFGALSFNPSCNKGTLASQSVVVSIALPGTPVPTLGATLLEPGAMVPRGSTIGLTWSGCYGAGSIVPSVVGKTFATARRAITMAGLTWACFSVGTPRPSTTTSQPRPTTSTAAPSSTTSAPSSTTTSTSATTTTSMVRATTAAARPGTVLSEVPAAGGLQRPGTIVTLTMHHCPQ